MADRDRHDDETRGKAGRAAPDAVTDPEAADTLASDPPPAASATDDALAAAKRERDELYDLLLRKTAEFENYRKRIDRERRDAQEYADADVLEDIIPVIDDFERALAHDSPGDRAAYREGIELIHRQLVDVLRRRGVQEIDAVGRPFDPRLHQAAAYEETGEHPEGQVVEQYRKGYLLKDRLLRPAMVKVAKGSA